MKLALNFLSTPLATVISNSLASSKFPGIVKVATVIPFDKNTDEKYDTGPQKWKKFRSGLVVYQKMFANLVSWLRRSFSWNRLTLIYLAGLFIDLFCYKLEIWYASRHTYVLSENISFSIGTSLILLMSADHASGVRSKETMLRECSKLTLNWKMTMTYLFVDKMPWYFFFWRRRFLLSNLFTRPSFMSISLLVLELWQFF